MQLVKYIRGCAGAALCVDGPPFSPFQNKMPSTDDAKWVAGLSAHRVGRQLASHLASMEAHANGHGYDCAIQEALGNERVFMHAVSRSVKHGKSFPCGLSSQLPKFIAILNLSGQRSIVYSESPALIRCLCSHSAVLHRSELENALQSFELFPMNSHADAMKFVVLTYSLPWQSGTHSAYWHLSACSVNTSDEEYLVLKDRQRHFSSTSAMPCVGKSVMDPQDTHILLHETRPAQLEVVSDKQIADFSESYSAICLDKSPILEPVVAGEGDERVEKILSLNHELLRARGRDQEEIRQLKIQLKELQGAITMIREKSEARIQKMEATHTSEVEAAHRNAKELADVAREQYEALCVEVKGMEANQKEVAKEQRRSKKAHEALMTKHAEVERQSAAKDALHNAALSKHVATISRLEGLLASSGDKADAARAELVKEHTSLLQSEREKHEAALSKVTLALESKERICNQLSENNERRNVEVESHKTHQAEQDRRIADLLAQIKSLKEKERRTRDKKPATRNASVVMQKNASTSTHQCASTQTNPPAETEEEEVVEAPKETKAPAVGAKVVERAASPAFTYQNAIDMLQELVTSTGNVYVPQMVPVPYTGYSGYPQPLPFPHFMPQPANGYHEPNGQMQPRFSPNPRVRGQPHRIN